MKAIGLFTARPADDPASPVERDIPDPTPDPGDLLVRIEAVSVNPADCRMRGRKLDDGRFAVLGWDAAGEVVGMGADVRDFALGDRVYYAGDLSRPGANSEFHVVDAAIVARRPASLTASEAAALPLTALTAWEALFDRIGLSPDRAPGPRTLLVVGGAGGVGSMAIQLARFVPELTIVATASRPASRAWCERLGAHAVIDHFADMGTQLADLGLPRPDLVLLLNDPDRHYPALAELLEPQGLICSIVPFDEAPDLNLLMRKSAGFLWEFMFTRPMSATADKARQGEILARVAALVDEGRLSSTATAGLGPITAANLRIAHARLEAGHTLGKIVLSGFPSSIEKREPIMTATALVQTFLGDVFSGRMDAALAVVDPQAVFASTNPRPNPSNPLHGTFIGMDGAKAFFEGFGALLEPGDFDVTSAFGDDEHAALYGSLRHKGRATGRDFVSDWALICRVREGRLVLYHFYEDTEALSAAIA